MKLNALLLISAGLANAAQSTPTQKELEDYLTAAKVEWGISTSDHIEIHMGSLNACNLNLNYTRAAQIVDHPEQSTTTFRADTDDEDAEPIAVPPPITATTHRYEIVINSECDWSHLSLRNTVVHEYGHFLTGMEYHSANPASVMYPIVKKSQKIQPEDLARITVMASK